MQRHISQSGRRTDVQANRIDTGFIERQLKALTAPPETFGAADIAAAALLDTLDAVADTPAAARVVAMTGNLDDARRSALGEDDPDAAWVSASQLSPRTSAVSA